MKIFVKVKTRAKENKVTPPEKKLWNDPKETEYYSVSVKAEPIGGKANAEIIRLIAEYFSVSKTQVKIISGFSSKLKVFKIGR